MDRIPLSCAMPIYLAALIVAIAGSALNVYDFHARGHGTETFEPWRAKVSAGVARVTSVFRAVGQFLWGHRDGLAGASLIALMLIAPHSLHAHAGLVVVAGQLHVAQLESDMKAKAAEAKVLLEKTMHACADHVVKAATATEPEVKGRPMTAEEKGAIQAILDDAKAIKVRLEGVDAEARLAAEIQRLTGDHAAARGDAPVRSRVLSMGQQFIADPKFRDFIKNGGHRRSSAWTSPAVDLHATTLTEDTGSGGPLLIPQLLPGIQPLFFRRLTIGDLLPQGTTTSNMLMFLRETTFTNAAATVAEGASKPESTLVFAQATSPVQVIAHWLPVTEQMLEDYATIQSYIDARLRLGLDLTEEDQLLNGDGNSPNLTGLMTVAGMTATQAAGADSNADAIFKEITKIATTAFVQPDGIVINPINWQSIQLAKNANGQYFGAGPWAPPQPSTLWGLPVAVTPAIVANTALVGGFRMCAQEFTKGGVRVEATNSHSDFFTKNLVAIRAEERLALAIYRPAGFGKVTGLN